MAMQRVCASRKDHKCTGGDLKRNDDPRSWSTGWKGEQSFAGSSLRDRLESHPCNIHRWPCGSAFPGGGGMERLV
eukprot:scaffold738_cov340-Pavlova_lutheri.AAC.42